LVPASGYGQPIPNPNGTAPGVIIENNNKVIICFPGPPNELIPMLNNYVVPFLAKRAGESAAVILSKTLRLTGIGESQAEETVKDLLLSDNPSVAPLAKPGECWLRITAKAQTKELAQSLIAPKEAALRERLGDYVYGVDNENLEYAVVELAKRKKAWIATAESCTGGLLAHRITTIPGASDIFATGRVAYANETKSALADVRPETIQKYGAVSEETAREMAIGVKNRYGAQIGLSTTGIAGPGGGTESKPVGLVYVGIAKPNGSVHVEGHVLTGSRTHVMVRASQTALTFARLALLELPDA
jgi:nicotinamide-nucleotide amidase